MNYQEQANQLIRQAEALTQLADAEDRLLAAKAQAKSKKDAATLAEVQAAKAQMSEIRTMARGERALIAGDAGQNGS